MQIDMGLKGGPEEPPVLHMFHISSNGRFISFIRSRVFDACRRLARVCVFFSLTKVGGVVARKLHARAPVPASASTGWSIIFGV